MIIYKKGDVVEAFKKGDIDVLVHGVNCQGKMNSGIAKQIRAEFPQVFEKYSELCAYILIEYDRRGDKLGHVQYIHAGGKGKYIANAFTQDSYGYEGVKFCSYDAIHDAMDNLARYQAGRIGMPKIGAGLGGGDWNVIEAIINSHFKDRDVYVYEL